MRPEVPRTTPDPTHDRRENEIVVVLHYPRNTKLLKIRDEMDQIDRRLIAFADGSFEAVRR